LPVISVSYFLCGTEYSYALQEGRSIIAFIDASSGQLVGGTAVLAASRRSAREVQEPKAALRAELLLAVRDANPKTARSAVGAVAELDGQASVETLKQYADAKDFGTRFRALTWLTRFGDADAFDEVARIVSAAPFKDECPNTVRNDKDESFVMACDDLFRALGSFGERGLGGSTAPPRWQCWPNRRIARFTEQPLAPFGGLKVEQGFLFWLPLWTIPTNRCALTRCSRSAWR